MGSRAILTPTVDRFGAGNGDSMHGMSSAKLSSVEILFLNLWYFRGQYKKIITEHDANLKRLNSSIHVSGRSASCNFSRETHYEAAGVATPSGGLQEKDTFHCNPHLESRSSSSSRRFNSSQSAALLTKVRNSDFQVRGLNSESLIFWKIRHFFSSL